MRGNSVQHQEWENARQGQTGIDEKMAGSWPVADDFITNKRGVL